MVLQASQSVEHVLGYNSIFFESSEDSKCIPRNFVVFMFYGILELWQKKKVIDVHFSLASCSLLAGRLPYPFGPLLSRNSPPHPRTCQHNNCLPLRGSLSYCQTTHNSTAPFKTTNTFLFYWNLFCKTVEALIFLEELWSFRFYCF